MNSQGFSIRDWWEILGGYDIKCMHQNIFTELSCGCGSVAYALGPWPRIREMTSKSLHDHHIARLAWRARRSRITTDPAMGMFAVNGVSKKSNCSSSTKPWRIG
jgi:hypothetical protein